MHNLCKHLIPAILFIISSLSFAQSGNYNDRNPASKGFVYQVVDSNSSDNLQKLAVGDLYGGVILFYVAENGLSGLGVALEDTGRNGLVSDDANYLAWPSANGIGAGMTNTIAVSAYNTLVLTSSADGSDEALDYSRTEDGLRACNINSSPPELCFSGFYIGSLFEYKLLASVITKVNEGIEANGGTPILASTDTRCDRSDYYWTINAETGDEGMLGYQIDLVNNTTITQSVICNANLRLIRAVTI